MLPFYNGQFLSEVTTFEPPRLLEEIFAGPGMIEPLGVHKDFRQLGLGRAILSEGLRRLYLCGADRVYVETDKYRKAALELYEAVGFRLIQDVLVYRKDYR